MAKAQNVRNPAYAGGDQEHFQNYGRPMLPETKVPMVPKVTRDENDKPHDACTGEFMTEDEAAELESGCGCCRYHHRADFYGDCRNDDESYDRYDELPYGNFGFEPDYVCADDQKWISRRNQSLAFAAGVS